MKNKQKSFTVIELLVVIAIIGLLASIVIVSIKGSRDKAKKAKVIQFSASVHHTVGAYIVGEWKFEGNINDTSGNNYTIIEYPFPGAISFQFNDYSTHLGQAGEFNGWSNIEVEDNTDLNKSPLDIEKAITIEAWMKPYAFGDYNIVVVKEWSYFLYFSSGWAGLYLQLVGVDSINVPYSYFPLNKWHHLVATYNGSKMQIFVNGEEVESKNATGTIAVNTIESLFLGGGATCPGGCYFQGLLDEIRIYEEGLGSAQIKKLYVEGAKKRGIATND